jgi:hypothetical protein
MFRRGNSLIFMSEELRLQACSSALAIKNSFKFCWRRSQWPRGLRHELSSPAPTLSWVRILLEAWMFLCDLCAFILCLPRVEAGKNTSTVIPASHKRRREGNPVVSDKTVMYGYEPSATLTTDRFYYKLQTRPLVRESPCGGE